MKVIMTGGGTGGHIYPAIAIADEIKRRNPDAEIIFVGTEKGMEGKIVPAAGYRLRFITVSGLKRKEIWRNVQTVKDLNKGLHEAKSIIREFRPDFVIGTGGYVCGPMVFTAARMGIPCYIHEQNAFPGLTNKLLSKFVDGVFVAFEEASGYFKTKKPPVTVGNPVRHAFAEADRTAARQELGLADGEFAILSFGGSLGAKRINDEMQRVVEKYGNNPACRIFFVTGRRYYKEIMESVDQSAFPQVTYLEYLDNMPVYLNACDLAICRSGALTVSEICVCGCPSVMIPSPYVTGNHQYYNAKVVADKGGAVLIEEKNLAAGGIAEAVGQLLADPEKVEAMRIAAGQLGVTDAAPVICDRIGIK